MKAIIVLLLSLFYFDTTSAQSKKKTDLDHDEIKGQAAHVVSKRFNVIDTLGKEQKVFYFSESDRFDRNGNRIHHKTFNVRPEAKHFDDSTAYTYDINGNLIKEEEYDSHNNLSKVITTKYDSLGRYVKKFELEYERDDTDIVEDSSITIDTYTYNQLNLIRDIVRVELLDSGRFSSPRVYISNFYEDSGRIRRQLQYPSVSNPVVADTSYLRKDDKGRIVEEYNSQTHSYFSYYEDGKFKTSRRLNKSTGLFTTTTYQYDKWGNRISSRTGDSAGKIVGDLITSRYLNVDKKGNWKEVYVYRNGKLVYYCSHEIGYY